MPTLGNSHQHQNRPPRSGGDDRDRTGDLLRARQPLSQLSYVPIRSAAGKWWAEVDLNYRPRPYQGRALTN